MRLSQIEEWAMEIIERIENGHPHEDARVELKAEWIEPRKAARQIAGHANAARGQSFLWLIGVDQENGVVGVLHEDLADWYTQVQAEFEGISPSPIDLNIIYGGRTFVALLFETERGPYVVRNPAFGTETGVSISYEVPWREGTLTRTARRKDLLKLLVPLLDIPEIEVLGGELKVTQEQENFIWSLEMQLYVVPKIGTSVAFPFHRSEVSVEVVDTIPSFPLNNISMAPPSRIYPDGHWTGSAPDTITIAHSSYEVIVQGPGRLNLYGEAINACGSITLERTNAFINAKILPTNQDIPITIQQQMIWKEPERPHLSCWVIL